MPQRESAARERETAMDATKDAGKLGGAEGGDEGGEGRGCIVVQLLSSCFSFLSFVLCCLISQVFSLSCSLS